MSISYCNKVKIIITVISHSYINNANQLWSQLDDVMIHYIIIHHIIYSHDMWCQQLCNTTLTDCWVWHKSLNHHLCSWPECVRSFQKNTETNLEIEKKKQTNFVSKASRKYNIKTRNMYWHKTTKGNYFSL